MNMAMGSNGKLHLVGWKVNDRRLGLYQHGAGGRRVRPDVHGDSRRSNPDNLPSRPGIDLVTDDIPIIAYGVGAAGSNHYLYYQEYNPGSGVWGSAQTIQSNTSSVKYAPTFVCLFSSDFKPHIWYLSEGTIYHTLRMNRRPSIRIRPRYGCRMSEG